MVSLVSAPVLGYDLVRHPQGEAVATVLLRALTCGPAELDVFAAARARTPESSRLDAWTAVRASAAAAAWSTIDPDGLAGRPLAQLVTELRDRMIVDLDGLDALLRTDVFDWCSPAGSEPRHPAAPVDAAVVREGCGAFLDAIASVWPRDLDATTRRVLAGPYLSAGRSVPWCEPDLGPMGDDLRWLLRRLGSMSADDRTRLRAASEIMGASGNEWSLAVHEASWAVLTTGRIRAAAAAQLLGVRAFVAGGLDATDGADGVWNAVSGHLHATAVADVLPDEVRHLLGAIWRSALGGG